MALDWRYRPQRNSDFYRDKYRSLMTAFMVEIFIILMLVGIVIYLLLTPSPTTYYATSTGGQLLPLTIAPKG